MYAVIKAGGKQYKVAPGQKIKLEQIAATVGLAHRGSDPVGAITDRRTAHHAEPSLGGDPREVRGVGVDREAEEQLVADRIEVPYPGCVLGLGHDRPFLRGVFFRLPQPILTGDGPDGRHPCIRH
mgnify:CR=1 FL=1